MNEDTMGWQQLMTQNHAPEHPPEPSEVVNCTLFDRCKDCPYPAHGFICWHDEEHCMRTLMEKIQQKEGKYK